MKDPFRIYKSKKVTVVSHVLFDDVYFINYVFYIGNKGQVCAKVPVRLETFDSCVELLHSIPETYYENLTNSILSVFESNNREEMGAIITSMHTALNHSIN